MNQRTNHINTNQALSSYPVVIEADRPDILIGATYKFKPPHAEHASYITINDTIENEGEENQTRRPYEIFMNSKKVDHFQWITGLTRTISLGFRSGIDPRKMAKELGDVFDPNGGYIMKGGGLMPSDVAEIGSILTKHMDYVDHCNKEYAASFMANRQADEDDDEDESPRMS